MIKVTGLGTTTVKETVTGKGEYQCAWSTFRVFWRKHYSQMVIPWARTNICGDCYIAANGFRSNAEVKRRSSDYLLVHNNHPINSDIDSSDSELEGERNDDCEARERILIDAAKHCSDGKNQRELFNRLTAEAKAANFVDIPHHLRIWVLVADYCENMGVPNFGGEQPGETFYYSPLNVFCFGVVDCLLPQDHLYANLYHEGQGLKGGNNVASLLMKVLTTIGAMKESEEGGPLTIVMDNCGGQNKNRMVLQTALFLVECGYFSSVLMLFLVRGHTKNNCDRLFNLLKDHFQKQNVYSHPQLLKVLEGEFKTILETRDGEFNNWDVFLDRFYKRLPPGSVQINQNFLVEQSAPTVVTVSVAEGDKVSSYNLKANDGKTKEQRVAEMRARASTLASVPFPGIKEIKQMELHKKWKPFVPKEWQDEACPKPDDGVIARQKEEFNRKRKAKVELMNGRKKAAELANKNNA